MPAFIIKLFGNPLWFALPVVFVVGIIGASISGYEPLVFDPSQIEDAAKPKQAIAAEIPVIQVDEESRSEGTPAPASVSASTASIPAGVLADGTWTGYAACGVGNADGWSPYYVGATVTVEGGKAQQISNIHGSSSGNAGTASLNWNPSENQVYLDWAISGHNGVSGIASQINLLLAAGATAAGVDMVSGATYSSASIFNAYVDALSKSAAAAGSTVEQETAADPVIEPEEPDASDDPDDESGQVDGLDLTDEEELARFAATGVPSIHGKFADGTYRGYALCEADSGDWSSYYIIAEISVEDGVVKSLDKVYGDSEGIIDGSHRYNSKENAPYLNKAMNGTGVKKGIISKISARLKAALEIVSVDTISGATISSKAIYAAFADAIRAAHESAQDSESGNGSDDEGDEPRSDEPINPDASDDAAGTGKDDPSGADDDRKEADSENSGRVGEQDGARADGRDAEVGEVGFDTEG